VSAKLRALQHRFRAVLEAMNDGFAVIDRDWRFVYANPAAARFVNKLPTDFVGRRIWDLFLHTGHCQHCR
jgi:PAS domain S-box-containing protein